MYKVHDECVACKIIKCFGDSLRDCSPINGNNWIGAIKTCILIGLQASVYRIGRKILSA